VEPEETSIARQRFHKKVSAATDTKATIEELLGTMFSIQSGKVVIKKSSVETSWSSSGVPNEQLVES
jgi:hypothetical protein